MSKNLRLLAYVLMITTIMSSLIGCTTKTALVEETTDVVVIGSGAAGLASAIEAANVGASVILVEKMPVVGGSTLLSGGIIYGTNSPLQQEQGIEDSVDALVDYWMERAEGNADRNLLEIVAKNSGETIKWLMDNGVVFSSNVTPAGTSPVPRAHYTAEGRGFGFIEPLKNVAEEKGIKILLETTATELIEENGAVVGVKAKDKEGKELIINSKAIVMATGGFDQSEEMKNEYAPVASGHFSYASQGNVGDGLKMAKDVGADILHKDGVIGFRGVAKDIPYTHPIGGLIWTPGLYVGSNGERFTSEVADYPIFYTNMVKNGSEDFYLILDSSGYSEALDDAIEKGVGFKGSTIEELADNAGIDKEAFIKTVERYNELAAKGEDSDFGKPAELMNPLEKGDFYALKVEPATLGTFGGLVINENAQVLKSDGTPIPGLYAAGEVANGQFFYREYPASGTSIQICFTFGRIAGKNAANYK